jgi:hypothetical protein
VTRYMTVMVGLVLVLVWGAPAAPAEAPVTTPPNQVEWPPAATTAPEALRNIKFMLDHELLRQETFYTDSSLQRLFGPHQGRIRELGKDRLYGWIRMPYGWIELAHGATDAGFIFGGIYDPTMTITVEDIEALWGRDWEAVKTRPSEPHQNEWPPPTRPRGNLCMLYRIGEWHEIGAKSIAVQFRHDATLMHVNILEHGALITEGAQQ